MSWWDKESGGSVAKIIADVSANAGATGSHVHLSGKMAECILMAKPGGGGTCAFEYTFDKNKLVEDADASVVWTLWAAGQVAADTSVYMPIAPTAIRLVAVTAAGEGVATSPRIPAG